MAHFYGTVKGTRGKASRLGTKHSGLTVTAQSWQGSITVRLFEADGADCFSIRVCNGSGSGGREIMSGRVDSIASDVDKRWSA